MHKKAFLIILDGWGHGKDPKVNAIAQASTPYVDSLYQKYPHAELVTFGEEVGLPTGQMGNSEVGHLNIGAGRIVFQELARINNAIADGSIKRNEKLLEAIEIAKQKGKPIHLLGLLSDGGVHSHLDHIIAIGNMFSDAGIKVYVHAFLDGRDTGPQSGHSYLETFLDKTQGTSIELSSVVGRYYAMDRDNRWERIAKAYNLLVKGEGEVTDDILESVKGYYAKEVTDEFMEAIKLGSKNSGRIEQDDIVVFANFRTDRPRQLTRALTQEDLEHDMKKLNLHFVTMTEYDSSFKGIHVAFTKDNLTQTLGDVVASKGLKQLRIAETEKYPHVTFFFSGGKEEEVPGEHRIVINSPKVATYDLQPEMSAYEVTNAVHNHILEEQPELIILNYANADMVGHTGSMPAAIKAVETLDACLEALIPIAIREEYNILIIADHGNSDKMQNQDGSPHTAHTVNMVPVILVNDNNSYNTVKDGVLADVAPTLLHLMNIAAPKEMTGKVLVTS